MLDGIDFTSILTTFKLIFTIEKIIFKIKTYLNMVK